MAHPDMKFQEGLSVSHEDGEDRDPPLPEEGICGRAAEEASSQQQDPYLLLCARRNRGNTEKVLNNVGVHFSNQTNIKTIYGDGRKV